MLDVAAASIAHNCDACPKAMWFRAKTRTMLIDGSPMPTLNCLRSRFGQSGPCRGNGKENICEQAPT